MNKLPDLRNTDPILRFIEYYAVRNILADSKDDVMDARYPSEAAKYQERLRRAREQMQRRKAIDIGKEVLTGKLNQTRLYSFMDEPAMEDRIDQI